MQKNTLQKIIKLDRWPKFLYMKGLNTRQKSNFKSLEKEPGLHKTQIENECKSCKHSATKQF